MNKALKQLHNAIVEDKKWLDDIEKEVLRIQECVEENSLSEAGFYTDVLKEKIKIMKTDFENAINQIRI